MTTRTVLTLAGVACLAGTWLFQPGRAGAQERRTVLKLELKDGKAEVTGSLTPDDPLDRVRKETHCKIYAVALRAGQTYQIDMHSTRIDSYLRLETPEGQQLAEDDDSGGNLDARIVFVAPKDGTYHIVALAFVKMTGEFTLAVGPPGRAAVPPANISGKYRCAGQDFDGDTYAGEVTITKNGDTYVLVWNVAFRNKNTASEYTGVGIRTDDVLSATWAGAGRAGVISYRVLRNGSLGGRWTIEGQKETRTEALTPVRP